MSDPTLICREHPSGKGLCPDGPLTPKPGPKGSGTSAWLVWSADLVWLPPLLQQLPRNHGLQMPAPGDNLLRELRPVWRLTDSGWFQHGRPAKQNTSRPGRMRWFPESFFADQLGLWWQNPNAGSEPPQHPRFSAAQALTIAQWLTRLEAEGVEMLGAYGAAEGRCAICRRPLTDEVSKKRGIGPECLVYLGVK
ncbi:hypothetical protein SynBIOSE41_03971 [Synechococcus sp. BIOS-E4-1]|uniref:DUF6011 domain-containing protein n=1 Tax=Synechococcus sp. BIOS-E4-1 TaxID=1400864 RepID=UPI001645BA53|nr:DUF6011 domain-containing protein [Synechococcus sp. BIOS-E4-1]QNI56436.1 hypothetical protein SynBIOSE41_03971 [Synechococcus sp. BIOS-E4-1]